MTLAARTLVQVRRATELVRFRSFDVTTDIGRTKERHRRLLFTAASAVAARAVGILTVLVSVRMSNDYLSKERYGLWLTISSVMAMLAFADMGLGQGLLSGIAEANGKDDRNLARRYVSSAFFMLLSIALVIAAVFAGLYPFLNWTRLFDITEPLAIAEAGPSMAVFLMCFAVTLPLAIVTCVQAGYQEGAYNNLWVAAGNVLGLVGVVIAIKAQAGLPWLVLAMAGGAPAAALCNFIVQFGLRRRWLFPRWRYADLGAARKLMGMGLLFFALSAAMAVAFASDNIVVAQAVGLKAVPQYAVPLRLFSTIGSIVAVLLMPLWPAYGESIARGDITWIKKTLSRSLLATFAISVGPATIAVVFGPQIIWLWMKDPTLQPTFWLLLGCGVWTVLSAMGQAAAMFLNGMNKLAGQVVFAWMLAIVGLGAKVALGVMYGPAGVIWGVVIAYILCTAVPVAIWIPKLVKELGRHPSVKPPDAGGASSAAAGGGGAGFPEAQTGAV